MNEKEGKKKKKKGSDASKDTSDTIPVTKLSGIGEVRALLRDFQISRTRSTEIIENLLNLYNKKSYYQKEKITEITSPLAASSIFSGLIEEELFVHIESLRKERIKIFEILTRLQDTWFSYSCASNHEEKVVITASVSLIEKVVSQATQQTALDELIADQLLFSPQKHWTQDELITMASCLKRSPYLNEKDLKWLIDNL